MAARIAGLALCLALASTAAPAFAADPDLGGEWHLDQVINFNPQLQSGQTPDSSGKGNDLNVGAGVTGVADGRFGNAFDFSQGGALGRSGGAGLQPQNVTLMGWVRSATGPGDIKYIAADGGDPNCNGSDSYALYTGASPNGNQLEFYVTTTQGLFESPRAPSTIWDGQWHAVAGTYDGSTVRFYLDGSEVGNGTPATGAIEYGMRNADFTAATSPGCAGSQFHFGGAIDELRVYDRALSGSELHQLQTASGPNPPELAAAGGGGGGGSGGGSGGGGGAGIPPIARVALGKSATMKNGVWLNGAGSLANDGVAITDYSWDVDGNGRFLWDCGPNAALSIAFTKPGEHTVGLQVKTATGQLATVRQQVTVTRAQVKIPPRVETFDCENPGADNQPDRADCVKSFGFGVVDVNSRGTKDDCFQITSQLKHGIADIHPQVVTAAARSPLFDYTATVNGPVALNGLYLPLPETAKSNYDSGAQTIGIGRVDIQVGQYKTIPIRLSKSVAPDRHGNVHLVDVDLSGTPKLLGGLPVGGGISVDLARGISKTKLHVTLPIAFSLADGRSAQGDVFLISNNADGVQIDGAQLGPVAAFLGPVFVDKLTFKYLKSQDLWQGGAKVVLPGGLFALDAAPPPPDLGFGIRGGRFDHAGLQVDFQPPAQPELFPGIFLTHIGGAFGLQPVRFTGTAGVTSGQIIDIDGDLFVAFASPEQPYELPDDAGPQLGPLAGRRFDAFTVAIGGTASAKVPIIDRKIALANAYLLYEYPDYVELAGGFKFDYSFLSIDGGVKGFVAPSQRKFSLEGGVKGCLRGIKVGPVSLDFICAQAGSVVSTKGFGFCTTLPIPFPIFGVIPVPVGAGYKWGSTLPDLMIFSCDYGDYRETSPRAAQASGGRSFALPSGVPSAMVRLIGRDGSPDATLRGPKGETIDTANPPGDRNVVVVHAGSGKETLVALKSPSPGTWTITPDAGSTPIVSAATADGLPAPSISARVSGKGPRRTLSYKAKPAPGRTVAFAERGPHAGHLLGTARGSSGRIAFTPASGPAETREIVALVDQSGEPAHSIVVAHYRSPGPQRLSRPRGLRASRRGAVANASWSRVAGARGYAVTLVTGDGGRRMILTRGPKISVRLPTARTRATLVVNALSLANARGPGARIALSTPKRH